MCSEVGTQQCKIRAIRTVSHRYERVSWTKEPGSSKRLQIWPYNLQAVRDGYQWKTPTMRPSYAVYVSNVTEILLQKYLANFGGDCPFNFRSVLKSLQGKNIVRATHKHKHYSFPFNFWHVSLDHKHYIIRLSFQFLTRIWNTRAMCQTLSTIIS